MTLTRLIGDIHGQVYDYKAYAIDNFEGPTIQIGDFGIGFGQGDYWHESVDAFHVAGGHRFIRYNDAGEMTVRAGLRQPESRLGLGVFKPK
jgi:hypothetical protein